jgi:hypothetical protein
MRGCITHLGTWLAVSASILFVSAHKDGGESFQENLKAAVILLSLWIIPIAGWWLSVRQSW